MVVRRGKKDEAYLGVCDGDGGGSGSHDSNKIVWKLLFTLLPSAIT